VNQAEVIAEALGHYSIYQCKYGTDSLNTLVPIVNKQANAFLAAPRVEGERFHYFDTGIKRLIIELELDDLCVFLVHLSLKFRHRHAQLRHLFELVKRSAKPVIVAGDFNTFWASTRWRCSWRRPDCAARTVTGCRPTRPAPAHGARLHPAHPRHRGRGILDSRRHLFRSPPLDL